MSQNQDLALTLLGLTVFASLAVIAFRNHFAEKSSIKPHRPPWMVISLGSIALSFMILVHLANILGFETGNR